MGANNESMIQKKNGRKFEKFSIRKLKVGAASVLVGAGFFLGFHVEASEVNEAATNEVVSSSTKEIKEKVVTLEEKLIETTPLTENKLVEEKNSNLVVEKTTSTEVVEKIEQPSTEKIATVEKSQLTEKMTTLQEQLYRIRSNEKQKTFIEKAEKLLEEAKVLQTSSNATQEAVDAKAKEISSLTSILISIKAEETLKENKNQDSRNGKKMEEGTGFRTGVTDQALTGSIHFDTSKGPTEKNIPVANNGDGERVINMAITYSASSSETVTDGKVRVTIPKAFIHSSKKPVFTNSSFVKSTDDRSTETDYVYDLNLNPMSGGSVAESLLKLYVGTSRTNAPSKDDSLTVKTEFINGGKVLTEKTATATFDYLSEIIYREKDTREKLVKNYLPQEQREYKIGSVVDGKLVPVSNPFRIPLIMTNDRFFNNGEADDHNQNGNGRLISYDYTISGIPEFLELDPTSPKNSKWTLENGVATLHPDQKAGIDQMLYYAGPVLRLKEGALSTPEEIAKVIESNGTKGYSAKIVYKAVGHRPDGSSFTQTLENPDGFRIYAGDGAPSIGMMEDRINAATNQRLFSNASNVDTFGAVYRVPLNNLKTDGGTLPSQYLSYLIPKDQEGNYFTKFKITQIFTNELENGSSWVRGYHSGYKDVRSQFKENFQLYGVNENNQAELIKDYTTIDELFNETTINSDKKYNHLILKTPGIVDEVQDKGQAGKTILGLTSDLDVTVDTWKEKAKDTSIQRYENKISQVLAASNTIESAIATERPNTGSSTPAVHTKEPTTLSLGMQQIGDQELTKDNLTRGKNIPIAVQYTATDYFKLAESEKNSIKVYDLDKLDSNINKTSVMLLADPKVPLKDFRLTADNRLLSKNTLYFGGTNGSAAKGAYDQIKESYDTVNPTRIIENYKGTGKRAYIFESKDLGISSYDLNRDGWIKGGTYNPVALTFEVENNGQIESGTYNIESYLVWNSNSATLFGNDRSLNANYVEGHEPGATIAKSNINVTMNNVIEYSTSLTISKPGSTGTRGIIDVKNGQEVILSPRVENLTDTPQKIKEAVVLIPKSEAVTYLEGPIVDNSDEYDVVYTTSTATDKTTGTYVTADQITNWKDVTAVKYVFKNDYTVTKQHGFTHNFNLRVAADNPNFVESTSQIFLKNNQNVWLESNTVGLRTEDVRGKLEVRYINNRKDDILPKIYEKDFAGQPYKATKEDIIPRAIGSGLPYLFKEIQADSVPETGTYERQVTKKVTYIYEEATFKEESKTITRTINYLEKNNESNVVANPVVQNITVKRKIYTGKETGRVVEGPWEYRTDAYQPSWPTTNSPKVTNFEAPDREVIDRVLVSQELVNNGNVVENVYYEKIMPIGGDVVAKYVIEGTTTELKPATDVAKGLKVGKSYTSTAPIAGEELTATDGKVYVYKGHKATSAGEIGKVTTDKQEVVYEYAPKVGGKVEVKYVISGTDENLKDPLTLVMNGQVGSDYTATKDATITKEDGRVYKLVEANNGLKTGSAGETGKVTTEKQTVTYEYELQKGDVTVNYTDVDGQPIEEKTSVKAETQSPTGKQYNTNTPDLKPETITTDSGKVYKLVPSATVGNETGKVTVDPITVTYKYELQKGNVTVNYTDVDGQPIEGKTSQVVENQSPTGTNYNTNTPALKPETITTDSGKVYKLVPSVTVGNETGKVTVDPITVTYKYELQKGDVTVNYNDTEGNAIEGKTSVKAESQSPTGKEYNTNTPELKPETITTDSGKVYKLVPAQTVGKEKGKVTVEPTEVTYKYELQKGDVTVNYTDTEGNAIEGKTSVKAESQSPTGKEYNTNTPELKPETITTESGKVYKLVPAQIVGRENGKVTVEPTEVTYKYELQKGDVTVNYTDVDGKPIEGKPSVKAETQSPTGKEYNTNTPELKPETITTESGKVYKLVPAQTVGKENGKVTVEPTEVTYKYELQKGNVTVNYTDVDGQSIEGKTSEVVEKQSPTGKEYNTNTPALKPETITTESGKVYKLVPSATVGTESGKVTVDPITVTYKYELQKGDVTVNYTDTEGNAIEGKSSVKAENQSPTGKEYNTNTPALKPETITTESGKVYKLVPAQTVGKETGKVTVEPTEVTYKYELQKGDVTVNYTDVEGQPIEGKPSVKVEDQSETGKQYNTNTPDLKPETITTANGDVYEFVKKSETSASETGKVNTGVTTVEYVYRKVVTSYVNEEGKEINPSDKGTKDKKDIPEYIYKETKKDEKGNTIHVYRKVVTSYVDEEGKEINPSDKGTKDKKDIPEYIYKETKKDEKGNTTYVYRQVVTSYVDEEGKEINPSDKGTKDKKDIPEYIYKETKKDEKGNTTHVYRQVVTSYVDEEGKEINPSDKGTKDKKDIPEYIYKETKKDEKGNTTHVYRQVVTSYVDEEGKEINPSDKGTKDKKEISGYTFKETKKDKDGNTIHVYTKKSSSTPETPKPTPETPNTDESKSTIWKSVDGETLKPRENGTKDKSSIPGYEFVRTETESSGNVRHVYRQVAHSESKVDTPTTVEERKNELPNTGTGNEFTIFGAAAASILAGLGIAIPGKKKED